MKGSILKPVGTAALTLAALALLWIGIAVWRIPSHVRPETSGWQTGDIFFSVGDSWKSVAVRSLSGAKDFGLSAATPSHCGIVIVDSAGVRLVHESTSARRIVAETPEEYIRNNGSYCIYARRPPCRADSVRLLQTVDSLMRMGVPFDFEFDHSDGSALYCTEMVVSVLEKCGCRDVSDLRDSGYIFPQDLLRKCPDGN